MNYMNEGKEGKTKFGQLTNARYRIETTRGKQMKSFQLNVGTYLTTDLNDLSIKFGRLKHSMKQFWYSHVKDGYYTKDFLFIPNITDVFQKTGKGYCLFEFFFFLEEPYDKDFVYEYFGPLIREFDDMLSTQDQFKYHKIKQGKLVELN